MLESVYLYVNPAKDNLVDSIDKFPGLSSWKQYRLGKHKKVCPWINRGSIRPLLKTSLSFNELEYLARKYVRKATEKFSFTIFPDAWMECFDITDAQEKEKTNKTIVDLVREREAYYRQDRATNGKTVIGVKALALQAIDTPYVSERSGRMTWCISKDIELRKERISKMKRLVERAREVYERWKIGDFSIPYPLGLFPPSMPKLAEALI